MIEYPGFFQRLQKIRSPKLLPDFDRFCCSTEQDYQPAENATSTGITSAQLRAKAELMLVTATARSSGVNDGKAFVETSADGSRASSSFHLSGNLTNAALNPARSSDPDPCVTAKSAYTGDISGHQIDDQLCTPGDDVPQGYDRFAGNEGAAYGVDTRYSSIDIPYGGCRRPQNDPSHSSNYYKQYDDSLGHSVPSPTRVDECSQFFEGDPSFVQQSNEQPMQILTHFEQAQFFLPSYPLNHQLGTRYINPINSQSHFRGGDPPFEHQSFEYSTESVHEYNENDCENESVNEYYANDYENSAKAESDNMVDDFYSSMRAQSNRKKYMSKCGGNSSRNRHDNSICSSYSNSSANEYSQDSFEIDAQMENEYLNDDDYHTHPVSSSRQECARECAMHTALQSGSNEFFDLD